MKHIVVTIDGPGGTGKSTVAREVAKRLRFLYLDTGALYRAAAVAIENSGCRTDDDKGCAQVLNHTNIELTGDRVFLNGLDVTQRIRSHRISSLASEIAVHPSVRDALLNLQRSFREKNSLVAEGRDTGSVVFPDADVKIYLDASQEERARRRYEELVSKGIAISYEQVFNDLRERDSRDASRIAAPLVIPQHAIVVDTTHLGIENVIRVVLDMVRRYLSD
jgi:cytidylate kinase